MPDTPSAAPATLSATQVGHLVFVLGLAGFSSALTTRALDPLLVSVAADFNTSVERTALLASAFALPYALIQPILGPIGDALGKRLVMILCASLLVLALAFGALATSLPMLFVARVLAGAAAGGITPLALATFGDSVPMEERQVAMSRFMAWTIGGQVAGGAISGFLAAYLGWRGVLAACGLVVLVGAVVLWRDSRRHPAPPARRFDLSVALNHYKGILSNPRALRLFAGVAAEGLLVFSMFPFLAALLALRGLGGTAEAGMALGIFGLGGFAYASLAPLLVRTTGQANMMRLGGLLAGCGLLLVGLAGALAMVMAGTLLLGLGYFMLHNSIQVRVTEVAPKARGSAMALHACSFFLGQSLGPAVFGVAQVRIGTLSSLAVCAAGIALVGFWLAHARRPVRQA